MDMFTRVMEVLRVIWDAVGIPILWLKGYAGIDEIGGGPLVLCKVLVLFLCLLLIAEILAMIRKGIKKIGGSHQVREHQAVSPVAGRANPLPKVATARPKETAAAAMAPPPMSGIGEAAEGYWQWFRTTLADEGTQRIEARKCWRLLSKQGGIAAIPARFRKELGLYLADVFSKSGELYVAALCYFEIRNYQRCRELLGGALKGKDIDLSNIAQFYMLAVSYEQTGGFTTALAIFRRILKVNANYLDTAQRAGLAATPVVRKIHDLAAASTAPSQGQTDMPVQHMVQNLISDRYELLRELGRGGMGTVYCAYDNEEDCDVALKFIGSALDRDSTARTRFLREATTMSHVVCENVVKITDVGADAGKLYIVMEYAGGGSLAERLHQATCLPPQIAVRIGLQVCSALSATHQAGIIHRDLKPANILISSDDVVKLGDFGLAKIVNDSRQNLTVGDVTVGTPAFMSPEQAKNDPKNPVDHRTDIYCLGLVLYEILVGKHAIPAKTLKEHLEQMKVPIKPPRQSVSSIPKALDAIVMKCLASDPDKRFQTAEEVGAALSELKL